MQLSFDNAIMKKARTITYAYASYIPFEFTTAREEYLASRETAGLGGFLNAVRVYDVFGPDAVKFMNAVFANRDFAKLNFGIARHGLICNEKGQLLADGVVYKVGENRFRTYGPAPVVQYFVETSELDVQGEYIEEFVYQLDGPKSLEILEEACQCDLHDIKFARNKEVKICGKDTLVYRLGMSGALAYEVHGAPEDADIVFNRINEVLESFGGKLLGYKAYNTINHTPAGIFNQYLHYAFPWFSSDEGLTKFFSKFMPPYHMLLGSAADNIDNFYVTPYDVGWGNIVNFDHDFMGKKALLEISKNPPRMPVTLEWNTEDVGDVFMSQFKGRDVEPYDPIEYHNPPSQGDACDKYRADYILVDGRKVGLATGKTHSYYERKVISLAVIDKDYAKIGTDVIVLWGSPEYPKKEIRAKVARFPYFNEEYRNETFDTEKIPHPKF